MNRQIHKAARGSNPIWVSTTIKSTSEIGNLSVAEVGAVERCQPACCQPQSLLRRRAVELRVFTRARVFMPACRVDVYRTRPMGASTLRNVSLTEVGVVEGLQR